MKDHIHFILTGGTIDGFYNAVAQTATPGQKSSIPAYIKDLIKPYGKFTFKTVCMKDSRKLTDADRRKMAAAIQKTPAKKIIITHGTDTMAKTAEFLHKKLGPKNTKAIVLTGSMIPLSGFSGSDSGFNMGYACAEIRHLDPGVYICMNARIFPAGKVKKNAKKARFESTKT